MGALSTHPEDIRAAIRKKFGTLRAFEQDRGLALDSVRDVLRGKSVPKSAIAVADELGVDVHALFPGRFLSLKRDSSDEDAAAHALNARAA